MDWQSQEHDACEAMLVCQAKYLPPSSTVSTIPALTTLSIIASFDMTSACKAALAQASREALFDRYQDCCGAIERLLGKGTTFGLVDNGFRNSITFEYKDKDKDKDNSVTPTNRKSAKLFFSKGTLQVAGLKSYGEIPIAIAKITAVMQLLLDVQELTAGTVRVSFAQATLDLGFNVDTWQLCKFLATDKDLEQRHFIISMSDRVKNRLRIKLVKNFTLLVFATGKVILTGFTSPKAMAEAHEVLLSRLQAAWHEVHSVRLPPAPPAPPKKRGRKRKCETLEFLLLH